MGDKILAIELNDVLFMIRLIKIASNLQFNSFFL